MLNPHCLLCLVVFPFVVEEELITSSVCKILGWSILIQLFAKIIMGDILADTAILANASKKEPLYIYISQNYTTCTIFGSSVIKSLVDPPG